MKSSSIDIPVHDIAPLLEIQDYSLYGFIALITIVLAALVVIVKKMRMRRETHTLNERIQRYENFISIDINNPKAAAYAICEQGLFFAHDNEERLRTYRKLFERLEAYKYARTVESIDEETLALYITYQKMITLVG